MQQYKEISSVNNSKVGDIVILHGWGLSGEKYSKLRVEFENLGLKVFSPDFPGFGNQKMDKEFYTLDDYADYLMQYLKKNKIKKYILIGHSFGGRVIVRFYLRYKNILEKELLGIVLTGTPIVKSTLSARKKLGRYLSLVFSNSYFVRNIKIKNISRDILYRFIGERDYYKAGKNKLSETFKKVISQNDEPYLGGLNLPVLIVWGNKDKITPVSYAYRINKLIKNSKLVILDGLDHKLPYQNYEIFSQEVGKFLILL